MAPSPAARHMGGASRCSPCSRPRARTRDKLIALLWPEATPDRARPQLSDTLYILRHAQGEDAVRS